MGAALIHTAMNFYQIHSILDSVANLNFTKSEINTLLNMDFKTTFDENGKLVAENIKVILSKVHCNQTQFNLIMEAAANSQTPAVGASGAIYGLLVAFGFMFPDAQLGLMFIPIPIKAKYFIPGLIGIDLFLGFKGQSIFGGNGTGVAHFAHVGGAIFGFIIMWIWKQNQFNKNRWN